MTEPNDNPSCGLSEILLPLRENQISTDCVELYHSFGSDTQKRNNLHYIDETTIVTSIGNIVQFTNIDTWQTQFLVGIDGGGIGAVAISEDRNYIAIGERGNKPNIYIYQYPTLKLYKILRRGTEKSYSCLQFGQNTKNLASVGGAPDYMLTIWDWENESIVLRSKAFGQEVYDMRLSLQKNGIIVTGGIGHIKFWNMAETFTGLKLQGQVGKFGKMEISDIETFCIFPDGKVLSSTDKGSLLLWIGDLIRCEILQENKKLPHPGGVTIIRLEEDLNLVMTAGNDGYIKWWEQGLLENADAPSEDKIAILNPFVEINAGEGIGIRNITRGIDHYLAQKSDGTISKVKVLDAEKTVSLFQKSASGCVNGIASSVIGSIVIDIRNDKSINGWDYIRRKKLFSISYNHQPTAIAWCPTSIDPTGKTVAIGFADGVLRIFYLLENGLSLRATSRPHQQRIQGLRFSKHRAMLVSSSADRTVFIFDICCTEEITRNKETESTYGNFLDPLGFITLPDTITSFDLHPWRDKVLISCGNGDIYEHDIPQKRTVFDTYEINSEGTKYAFRRKRDLAVAELMLVNSEHETCKYFDEKFQKEVVANNGKPTQIMYSIEEENVFFTMVSGEHAGYLYKCMLGKEFALEAYEDPSFERGGGEMTKICYSTSGTFIITVADGGGVRIRSARYPNAFVDFVVHDNKNGNVTGISTSPDDRFLLTSGSDGHVAVLKLDISRICMAATEQFLSTVKRNQRAQQIEEAKWKEILEQQSNKRTMEEIKADRIKYAFASLEVAKVKREYLESWTTEKQMNQLLLGHLTESSSSGEWTQDFPSQQTIETQSDIDSSTTLSIQEAKKKSQEMIALQLPTKKKEKCYSTLKALKEELDKLLEANEAREGDEKLSLEDFDVDPEYTELLRNEGMKRLEGLVEETAYSMETAKLQSQKLRTKYFGLLEEICTVFLSLSESDICIKPYRVHLLADKKHRTTNAADGENIVNPSKETTNVAQNENVEFSSEETSEMKPTTPATTLSTNGSVRSLKKKTMKHRRQVSDLNKNSAKNCEEVRQQKRAARKEALEKMLKERPKDNEDDLRDLQAIKESKENMGDYKLKTADDYVVPNEMKMNSIQKRRQMYILEEKIHEIKTLFNQRLQFLYEFKQLLSNHTDNDDGEVASFLQSLFDNHIMSSLEKETLMKIITKEIELLHQEKLFLSALLKQAEFRLLVLYQELTLLNGSTNKDKTLIATLEKYKAENESMSIAIQDCTDRLQAKHSEMEAWVHKMELLAQEVDTLIDETANYKTALIKIFKKKVKRRSKKSPETSDGTEENDDEMEENSYDSEEDEDANEEDICPTGCSPLLYGQIIDSREKRLDYEYIIAELQKTIDEIKKTMDRNIQKKKQIEKELKSTEEEMQAFQNEKQQCLNQILVIRQLSAGQIYCFENVTPAEQSQQPMLELPKKATNNLVFDSNCIRNLLFHIENLKEENLKLSQAFRDLILRQRGLKEEKKLLEEHIQLKNEKCRELQLLKFGKLLDLEALDEICKGENNIELKEKLKTIELENGMIIMKCKKEQKEYEMALLQEREKNTQLLGEIAEYRRKQYTIENKLNTMSNMKQNEIRPDETVEREKLIRMVKLQSSEIEALKMEVDILKGKTNNLFTQPNHSSKVS